MNIVKKISWFFLALLCGAIALTGFVTSFQSWLDNKGDIAVTVIRFLFVGFFAFASFRCAKHVFKPHRRVKPTHMPPSASVHPIPATNRISIKPVPTSAPADYKRLSAKMSEWKKVYLLHDGSPTAERQKANLDIILRDPEHDLYQLSRHGSSCPFCAPREGRVYSRSGKSPDFPPLAMAFQKIDKDGPNVLWNTYLILHPDCLHSLIQWTHAGRSAEEINEIKRFSSPVTNPFSRDPRSPQKIEAFNRAQEGRRKWKESYNLFEECQSLGIENFPKTFQTFQKHQSGNSPKYQDWMNQYEQKKGFARPKVEELITVHTEHIDPDEGIETPPWAELSYMDIKALKFWSRKSTDFKIPDYYADTAFGRNVGPARDRLLEGGYLQLGDIRKSIELKTVSDLKEVLAGKELKTSGKKGELVQRLLDNIPPDELRDLFPVSPYEVTEKGREAFSQYEIIFENQDYGLGLSYYRILDAKSRNPEEEDAVILTKLISEDIEECYRTGNRTRYQEFLPKAARFMEGHGEDLAALELTILSYFVWTMEAKSIPASAAAEQNRYLARNVEDYARRCSLTFEQLTEHFVETVRKNKPFGMSSEANINYALSMLKSGLSIK